MIISVAALLITFWASNTEAHPISITPLPKEYYQRQNLPEIPGYIPVYIKHDVEPIVKWKENVRITSSNESLESEDNTRQENDVEVPAKVTAAEIEEATTPIPIEQEKVESSSAPQEHTEGDGNVEGNSPAKETLTEKLT